MLDAIGIGGFHKRRRPCLTDLDHESFAVHGQLALLGSAFYPVLAHGRAASLQASSPHSVAFVQLRLACVSL